MKRRLVLPTVLGVIAIGGALGVACSEDIVGPEPTPDGILPIPSSDGPASDALLPDTPDAPGLPDAGVDANVPLDSPGLPDTPA
jgi:hypothetical protein